MATIRVNKTDNYTVMSNYHFKEKEMSLKAKGLLSLMLSLPNDWDYSINGLATLSKDGKDSVMGALNELEVFGYLIRTRTINEKGQFAGYDYDIYEKPNTEKAKEEKPYTEKPNTENQAQLNTNKLNTNKLNTKELITKKDKKDKKDKLDKYDKPPAVNLSISNKNELNIEVHSLTANLIDRKLIKANDTELYKYNDLFEEVLIEYDYNLVCKVINYVIARMKNNADIDDKFNYFKASLLSNLDSQTTEYKAEIPYYNWQ